MAHLEKIESLIHKVETIIQHCLELKLKLSAKLSLIHPAYQDSAVNLIYYLALRKNDIRNLQEELAELGISSLGRPESHVMSNLVSVNRLLHLLANRKFVESNTSLISIQKGATLLSKNTEIVFGKNSEEDKVKIMVTLPTESAYDYDYVENLIKNGADCIRINCAHDNEEVWLNMIQYVHKAALSLKKTCPVFMDLGGPKLRTGAIAQGRKVIKLRPSKNRFGEVISPFVITIVPKHKVENSVTHGLIVVENHFYESLEVGSIVKFTDARQSKRKIIIDEITEAGAFASLDKTAYLAEDSLLISKHKSERIESRILDFPPYDSHIMLKKGDLFELNLSNHEGEGFHFDENRKPIHAHVSCPVAEVYSSVKIGEKVKFDDGTIEGVVQEIASESLMVLITLAKPNGSLLRADKSINFPESDLQLNGLTQKDKQDLKFVVQHADSINMSFVNRTEDVDQLFEELKKLKKENIGICLKIETQEGFKNLPMIILQAMQKYPISIFIARGDLAVEAGWERMAELQEEILWLCEAAHLPNIWGTQVLENMIKTGIPSRAEITDAAMSQRAECVMLNKGKYVVETIQMLTNILERMHEHQYKKTYRLRKLQITDVI